MMLAGLESVSPTLVEFRRCWMKFVELKGVFIDLNDLCMRLRASYSPAVGITCMDTEASHATGD